MRWKKLPYWLKGGIIGFFILVLFMILTFVGIGLTADVGFSTTNLWTGIILSIIFRVYSILMLPLYTISLGSLDSFFYAFEEPLPSPGNSIEPNLPIIFNEALTYIFVILYFILAGAIIGFIIGRIKSKKLSH